MDDRVATARIEATGHVINFPHTSAFAVPERARAVGTKGFISFPKVPPVFTLEKLEQAS